MFVIEVSDELEYASLIEDGVPETFIVFKEEEKEITIMSDKLTSHALQRLDDRYAVKKHSKQEKIYKQILRKVLNKHNTAKLIGPSLSPNALIYKVTMRKKTYYPVIETTSKVILTFLTAEMVMRTNNRKIKNQNALSTL